MEQIDNLLSEKHQHLFNLQDRWEDEKEYEDIKDYQKVVSGIFEGYGFTDVKLSKSFKITAKTPNKKTLTIKLYKSGKIDITESES